jgi:hypothetical protein
MAEADQLRVAQVMRAAHADLLMRENPASIQLLNEL